MGGKSSSNVSPFVTDVWKNNHQKKKNLHLLDFKKKGDVFLVFVVQISVQVFTCAFVR